MPANSYGVMPDEGTMADDKHASSSGDRHGKSHHTYTWVLQKLTDSPSDTDNDCHDSQMVPIEPNKHIEQPASGCIFHPFPHLPRELRRMVWEFALPRNVFWSARVDSKTRVPYPTIAFVCHEAFLVMKELGSMVTAWNRDLLGFLEFQGLPVTIDPSIHVRTWFSPKLDVIVLDPKDVIMLDMLGEAARCDLLDICRSPTTSLIVHSDEFRSGSPSILPIYERYLKTRDTVFLSIADHELIFKSEARDTIMAQRMLQKTRTMDLIRLDDTAAVVKYLKFWKHCCQINATSLFAAAHCDFGSWMRMALDEGKGAHTQGYMETYRAWIVEDEAYVKHSVTPKVYFLLVFADCIMSNYGPQPNAHRGHEIMDYAGKLKERHPLVRELDIKLPDVIPVCTIQILGPWAC